MDNPFHILNLPESFNLDLSELEKHFLAESSRHHPDGFSDPLEQADAADRMSALTQARQTLKDPERRANALLAILGGPSKQDDQSLPPQLLMEMMDVREELETAIEQNDAAELERHRKWAQDRREEHQKNIAKYLKSEASPDELKAARLELNALRYMNRMLDQIPSQ